MSSPGLSLAYCTNIWSHYQGALSREFVRLLGEDRFKMCLFEPVHEERRELGWASDVPDHRWIAGPPSSSGELERLSEIVCDADVAVLGSCPQQVQAARVATGKLTFIMGERMMRKGLFPLRMLNPRFARGIRRLRSIANSPNVHYLAIGEYAVADAKLIGIFDDRIWKWGYFVSQAEGAFRERSSSPVLILWAGRFLGWKRVDLILRAMAALGPASGDCTLELIGVGPTRDAIQHLAQRLGLAGRVWFREAMTPGAVRQRMAEADIYVLSSNHQEGWGAVLGEAMTEGCVVVASEAAGSSRILIEHGRTGFLFADGDVPALAGILGRLIANGELGRQVGRAAAAHMQRLWHPRVGAERLVRLCQGILGLAPMPTYKEGPCCRCLPK
jgi:glycosyltransferase involved in cell wall biosynthesis